MSQPPRTDRPACFITDLDLVKRAAPSSSSSANKKRRAEVEPALDETRAARVLELELAWLMGTRTLPPPLAVLRHEWRAAPPDAAAAGPRAVLSLDEVREGVVASVAEAAAVVAELRACAFVALDCEWSAHTLALVQVASPQGRVYLLDALTLGAALFADEGAGLRGLLQDPGVVKVLHDCRHDARMLRAAGAVTLAPVFDTQLAFAVHVRTTTGRTPLPCGLNTVLRVFANRASNELKEAAHARMEEDTTVWLQRPLDPLLVEYAMADVRHLPRAYVNLTAALGTANHTRVLEYSAQYASQLRDLSEEELSVREQESRAPGALPRYHLGKWDEEALANLRARTPRPAADTATTAPPSTSNSALAPTT